MKTPATPFAHGLVPILSVRDFREATEYCTKKLFFDLRWEWDKPPTFGGVGLVRDWAQHQQMTIGEMLEETLLHTFEEVAGGGVASPHGASTLKHLQTLKKQHGIDYDTHASYRFVEKANRGRKAK